MSEHEGFAAKDEDVEMFSDHRDGSDLQTPSTATMKSEEDDGDHATGATQAAINRQEDPPA